MAAGISLISLSYCSELGGVNRQIRGEKFLSWFQIEALRRDYDSLAAADCYCRLFLRTDDYLSKNTARASALSPSAPSLQTDGKMKIDVAVTDAAGQPVAGLTQKDFTLLDNQKARPIRSFWSPAKHIERISIHTERI